MRQNFILTTQTLDHFYSTIPLEVFNTNRIVTRRHLRDFQDIPPEIFNRSQVTDRPHFRKKPLEHNHFYQNTIPGRNQNQPITTNMNSLNPTITSIQYFENPQYKASYHGNVQPLQEMGYQHEAEAQIQEAVEKMNINESAARQNCHVEMELETEPAWEQNKPKETGYQYEAEAKMQEAMEIEVNEPAERQSFHIEMEMDRQLFWGQNEPVQNNERMATSRVSLFDIKLKKRTLANQKEVKVETKLLVNLLKGQRQNSEQLNLSTSTIQDYELNQDWNDDDDSISDISNVTDRSSW